MRETLYMNRCLFHLVSTYFNCLYVCSHYNHHLYSQLEIEPGTFQILVGCSLPLCHWTHGKGEESSLFITARLEALADFSCFFLSHTLPIVHRYPLWIGLLGWGKNTVQTHHLSEYSHYPPPQPPAIVRVSTVKFNFHSNLYALVRYAYYIYHHYCVHDIMNSSHGVVYSVVLRHLLHQPNANGFSHVSRVLI